MTKLWSVENSADSSHLCWRLTLLAPCSDSPPMGNSITLQFLICHMPRKMNVWYGVFILLSLGNMSGNMLGNYVCLHTHGIATRLNIGLDIGLGNSLSQHLWSTCLATWPWSSHGSFARDKHRSLLQQVIVMHVRSINNTRKVISWQKQEKQAVRNFSSK